MSHFLQMWLQAFNEKRFAKHSMVELPSIALDFTETPPSLFGLFDVGSQNVTLQEFYDETSQKLLIRQDILQVKFKYCDSILLSDTVVRHTGSLYESAGGNLIPQRKRYAIQIPIYMLGDVSFPDHVVGVLLRRRQRKENARTARDCGLLHRATC